MPEYARPPITEAVLELRQSGEISADKIQKIREHFEDEFPQQTEEKAIHVKVDITANKSDFVATSDGYQLRSLDGIDVLLAKKTGFGYSRLAPYCGWNDFRDRARRAWDGWKKIVGYREVVRIGIRYINRIDIPLTHGELIKIEDYLRIYPGLPDPAQLVRRYVMQCILPVPEENGYVVVNTGHTQSEVINHLSLLLDIDLVRDKSLPQNDTDIWAALEKLRIRKNAIFEGFITDKAREIFSQ